MPEQRIDSEHNRPSITVRVNTRDVVFRVHEATGAEIKSTAIAQGVQIQQDFNLFEKKSDHPLKQIGDAEIVKLHNGLEFRAVAPDDNS
jgi:hypothetical protein